MTTPTIRPHQCTRILYMTIVPLAEARQNFSALVDEAVTTHERIQVTRNGVPAVWMIAGDDFESILETLDVLTNKAAMTDVAQSRADASAGRYFTAAETEMVMAARAEGIDLGDRVDVIADMHARGLPDAVCMITLEAIIDSWRHGVQ
jgi:antitoxin YefM